jgi:glycosyltransferase involved in cell wall biosynthesis
MWPSHKAVADAHRDLYAVECGIGYPEGHFAPYKVFESYAMLHAYRGLDGVKTANGNAWWYDVVIPNYFDLADFKFSESKDDYLLFMGQRANGGEGKGIGIALQIAERTGRPLKIVGPGDVTYELGKNVEHVGFVGFEQRAKLMAHAKALLAPSLFVEPFCGVAIEAMLCGTPVISTDYGALAENNLHGFTGYRCRTMEQFIWSVNHIGRIRPADCRAWAEYNFSLEAIGPQYDDYFRSIVAGTSPDGWYAKAHTDMLARVRWYPPVVDKVNNGTPRTKRDAAVAKASPRARARGKQRA